MPIGEALALTYLAAGWIVLGGSKWNWPGWRGLGIGALAVTVVVVVRDGLGRELIAGPISGTTAFGAGVLGTYTWGQVLGLPRSIALLLGVGLMSRPLSFSNRLSELSDAYRASLQRAQEDPPSWERQFRAALRTTDAMAHLRAPDKAWASLRDGLVAQYRRWIELVEIMDTVGLESVSAELAAIGARWKVLADAAAEEQRAVATPARIRRGFILWYVIAGVWSVLVGLARARASWLLGNQDPTAALDALILLVMGVLALGYAVKSSRTR